MKEHTELEIKLLNYIAFLLGVINIYERVIGEIYKTLKISSDWMNENFDSWDKETQLRNMLKDLNEEFDWNFTRENFNDENKNNSL